MSLTNQLRVLARKYSDRENNRGPKATSSILFAAAEKIEELEAKVIKLIPKVKDSWSFPRSPICDRCGQEINLVAINGGDGWSLSWEEWCYSCAEPVRVSPDLEDLLVGEQAWPFTTDYVGPEDWKKLGIITEVG